MLCLLCKLEEIEVMVMKIDTEELISRAHMDSVEVFGKLFLQQPLYHN
jgi:hypothetical protein